MSTSVKSSPSAVKPQGCTNFKLRQLLRQVNQGYDASLTESGLKITQYSLLSHIVSLAPVRSVDLAEKMMMDTSTLSRNLKPLLNAGLIAFQATQDSRSHWVVATPLGQEARQKAHKQWKQAQEALNKQLGPARVLRLHQLIDEALVQLSGNKLSERI